VCVRARVPRWSRGRVRGGARGAVVSQLIGTATAATQSGESGVREGRIDRRTWTARCRSFSLAPRPPRRPALRPPARPPGAGGNVHADAGRSMRVVRCSSVS